MNFHIKLYMFTFRKILFLFSLFVNIPLNGSTIEKFNEIINGDDNGEYKIGGIKTVLFIIDNFEISHLFWPRKTKGKYLVFGLSCGFYPFADVIKISKKCTISFFNSHINFIRFILHVIRFFFHFYCDHIFANDRLSWDQALYKSAVHSLVLNTMCNIHLFTISCYNVKINLFSFINILTFCVYVIKEDIGEIGTSNNNTHDSGNNNNTNNNENNNTGRNFSFFINFNHYIDCYSHISGDGFIDMCLGPFKGSNLIYLLLYPRIEIFL